RSGPLADPRHARKHRLPRPRRKGVQSRPAPSGSHSPRGFRANPHSKGGGMMADNTVVPLNAWKGKLATSKSGPKKTITNLMLFLKNLPEFGMTIRWNELAQRAEWNGRPVEDSDLVDVRLILERHEFEPNVADILPAVVRHAKENSFHPVRDYLRSLKWDGTK